MRTVNLINSIYKYPEFKKFIKINNIPRLIVADYCYKIKAKWSDKNVV